MVWFIIFHTMLLILAASLTVNLVVQLNKSEATPFAFARTGIVWILYVAVCYYWIISATGTDYVP